MVIIHSLTTNYEKMKDILLSNYHLMFEDMRYVHDHPSPPNGKIKFRLLNDSRPDSMVVEYSYDYQVD